MSTLLQESSHMGSLLTHKYKIAAYSLNSLLLCFLTACSPNFAASPSPAVSSPSISGHIFTSYDNTELPLKVWLPAHEIRAVIIAVHGFNDYSNFIKDPASFFNDQKIAVYSYDQRGFGDTETRGRWSGGDTLSKDLSTFIALVGTLHPRIPLYVLGDSMGGAVAIAAMVKNSLSQVNGVILVAPAVWARSEMPFYQRWLLWLAAHTVPWEKVTGSSLDITASDNIEMLKELGKDPLIIKETRIDALYGLSHLMDEAYGNAAFLKRKTLVLYGQKDQIIPRKAVLTFYKRLPLGNRGKQQMILYENGYHMLLRDLQSETVLKDIVDWIYAQGQSLKIHRHCDCVEGEVDF